MIPVWSPNRKRIAKPRLIPLQPLKSARSTANRGRANAQKKRLFLWVVIMTFYMVSASGCVASDERATKKPKAATQEPTLQQTAGALQEDMEEPGGMTPIGPKRDLMFDIYNIPSDWPRVVPLVNTFQVTICDWSVELRRAMPCQIIRNRLQSVW